MAVKPFKVSVLNEPSHGLVASSLKELTHLGCKKLHLPVTEKKQVQVVLAEDGTLVDDEEYFSFLEPNTALVFLMPNQTWQPSCSRTGPKTAEMTEVDTGAVGEPEWLGPAQRLSMYPANILLLSDIQLQAVLETKLSDLACVVSDNKQAEALQDGCQQLLDDRDRRRETLQLLQLMRDQTPKNEDQMDSCLVPHSIMDTSLEARLCVPQPHVGLSTEELQDVVKMDLPDLINIPQKESVVNLCQEELKTRLMLVDTFGRSRGCGHKCDEGNMQDIAL
uniref:DNA fragmentation factor subunit alpha-like n=1 Tax=Myxine glutinosa TaxID=7769 RepID=UPI00358E56B1